MTLGLLGACLWMLLILVMRTDPPQWCTAPRAPAPAAVVANPITVIDLVAQARDKWSFRDLADLIRLAPGEALVAVNDHPVTISHACAVAPHYCAGTMLSGARYVSGLGFPASADRYADFTVSTPGATRRVLVLIH